jgi:L-asparaginase / beta-aspartyl-peptidase
MPLWPVIVKPSIIVHGGAGGGRYSKDDKRFAELSRAVEEGLRAMRKGDAVDGVEAAVWHLEECGRFNAGRGACLTADGGMELDAAVMSGEGMRGAGVGCVTATHHPVSVARWVMENTPHVLMVGDKTTKLVRAAGLMVESLIPSKEAKKRFVLMSKQNADRVALLRRVEGGTVGAVAVDSSGLPAAAVSTGGMWYKLPGRVGDSAVIGAGIFADSKSGAACATGVGEEIIRLGLTMKACDLMKTHDAKSAARAAVSLMSRTRGKGNVGIITVDRKGRVGASFNTEAMGTAWFDSGRGRVRVRG